MPKVDTPITITPDAMGAKTPGGLLDYLLLDAQGNLKVSVTGAGSGGTSSNFDEAFPAAGTAVGAFNASSGDMKPLQVNDAGELIVTTSGGGGGAVTIANGADVAEGATTDAAVTGDNTGTVSAKLRGLNKILADVWDSVGHTLKVTFVNTTIAVTNAILDATVFVDETDEFFPESSKVQAVGMFYEFGSPAQITPTTIAAPRITNLRQQVVTLEPNVANIGWTVFPITSSAGGDALFEDPVAVSAGECLLGGWYIYNPNAVPIYMQFYDLAAGMVTVGTDVAAMMLVIPPTSAANLEIAHGVKYFSALAVAATTSGGGTTGPDDGLEVNLFIRNT